MAQPAERLLALGLVEAGEVLERGFGFQAGGWLR